jgi:hypothetical protein
VITSDGDNESNDGEDNCAGAHGNGGNFSLAQVAAAVVIVVIVI